MRFITLFPSILNMLKKSRTAHTSVTVNPFDNIGGGITSTIICNTICTVSKSYCTKNKVINFWKREALPCDSANKKLLYLHMEPNSRSNKIKDGDRLQRVLPMKMSDGLCYPVFLRLHSKNPGQEQLRKDLSRYWSTKQKQLFKDGKQLWG